MEFRPEDISSLYGKRFFHLPDLPQEAEAQEETSAEKKVEVQPEAPALPDPITFLTGGAGISWKMKPDARLALVMDAGTFGNRDLIPHLKKAVQEAGINLAGIGFGVFPENAKGWEFSDMPVQCGIVLGACNDQLTAPTILANKHIVPAPDLASAVADPQVYASLLQNLQQAWQLARKA